MLCPKCGSEMKYWFTGDNYQCEKCDEFYTENEIRLDNVLSKFTPSEQFSDELYFYYLDLHDNPITEQLVKYICYDKQTKVFIDGVSVVKDKKLLFDYERNTTLKFVEHLLNDLEVK